VPSFGPFVVLFGRTALVKGAATLPGRAAHRAAPIAANSPVWASGLTNRPWRVSVRRKVNQPAPSIVCPVGSACRLGKHGP
jgi:hypothetical protein